MAIVPFKDSFRRATSLFLFVDWANAKILDWGGNNGNLLKASNGLINPSNYTCVDVGLDSIEQGKKEIPDATWIHWNRWNTCYNPTGENNLEYPALEKYDVVFSQSVYTHISFQEFSEAISKFKTSLLPGGYSCHTYVSTTRSQIWLRDILYKKRIKDYGSCYQYYNGFENIKDYCYLIDNQEPTDIFPDYETNQCVTLYNDNFLLEVFPEALLSHANERYQCGFSLQNKT
mgnify:CR=1 FL=1